MTSAPFVGDSLRDLQAAHSAGCEPVLVLTGKGQRTLDAGLPAPLAGIRIFSDLAAFANHLLTTDKA